MVREQIGRDVEAGGQIGDSPVRLDELVDDTESVWISERGVKLRSTMHIGLHADTVFTQ